MKKTTIALATLIGMSINVSAFSQQAKKDITLSDIWQDGKFYPSYVYGLRSMNDGIHYTALSYSKKEVAIVEYEYKTGKAVDTILKSGTLIPTGAKEPISIDRYAFTHDESKILIATSTKHIYRHSTNSYYYIWFFHLSILPETQCKALQT